MFGWAEVSDGDSVGDNMIIPVVVVVVVRPDKRPGGGSAGPVFPVGADVSR